MTRFETTQIPIPDGVHMVATAHGAHPEPPLDTTATPDEKLAWHATQPVYKWVMANGFPFHISERSSLWLSRDGRVLYGERFFVHIGRESSYSRVKRWDYSLSPEEPSLRIRTFAHPITRPLDQFDPELAKRIGLTPQKGGRA